MITLGHAIVAERIAMKKVVGIICIILLCSCASMFDDVIRGRGSSGLSDCQSIKMNCKGEYSEWVNEKGKVFCSCSGEY